MNRKLLNVFATTLLVASLQSVALAEDKTVGGKVDEAASDTGKVVKKGVRKVKDKTCTMIKGKMECAVEKAGNTIGNGVDEAKDKVEDIKTK